MDGTEHSLPHERIGQKHIRLGSSWGVLLRKRIETLAKTTKLYKTYQYMKHKTVAGCMLSPFSPQPQWLTSSQIKSIRCLTASCVKVARRSLQYFHLVSVLRVLYKCHFHVTPLHNLRHVTPSSLPAAVLLPLHAGTVKQLQQWIACGISIARHSENAVIVCSCYSICRKFQHVKHLHLNIVARHNVNGIYGMLALNVGSSDSSRSTDISDHASI